MSKNPCLENKDSAAWYTSMLYSPQLKSSMYFCNAYIVQCVCRCELCVIYLARCSPACVLYVCSSPLKISPFVQKRCFAFALCYWISFSSLHQLGCEGFVYLYIRFCIYKRLMYSNTLVYDIRTHIAELFWNSEHGSTLFILLSFGESFTSIHSWQNSLSTIEPNAAYAASWWC